MSVLGSAVPLALGVLALALFHTAFKYRDVKVLGRFELLFGLGNLIIMAMLFTIFYALQQSEDLFANVVFPIFQAMMWIYLLICLVLIFRLIRNIFTAMWRKNLQDYLGW